MAALDTKANRYAQYHSVIRQIPFRRWFSWASAAVQAESVVVPRLAGFIFALAAPIFVCTWQLGRDLQAPLFAFFFGNLLVAWLAGWLPGMVAAVWSTVLGNYFFLAPVNDLSIMGPAAWTSGLFLATTLSSVLLIGRMQQRNLDQQHYMALTRHNMARASRLQAITNVLSGATEPEAATRLVVSEGCLLLDAHAGAVALRTAAGTLALGQTSHLPDAWIARLQSLDLSLGRGFGQAMQSRQALWARSRREAPDAEAAEIMAAAPSAAAAWLPLLAGKECHGVLFFCFDKRHEFYQDDQDFALTLADQCAQALERARLFEETRATAMALRTAVHSRDDFLAVAGHELKTPLTALQLQVQGLQRQVRRGNVDSDRLLEHMQRQEGSIQRLTVLVNDLLDVSRISTNRLRLDLDRVDFVSLVNDVVGRFGDAAARAGCELVIDTDGQISGAWDRTRLEQVITNLLSNALKYGAGKPVQVHVAPGEHSAILTVSDQGIGISPKYQQRIFERYERAVSEREFGGLGLGLWITRQIVEASGGSIAVQSILGEGSTFRVELPVAALPSRSTPAQAQPN